MTEEGETFRERCTTCLRPKVTCLCSELSRLPTRTRFTIFQHPRERLHALGTARICKLGLEQCELMELSPEAQPSPTELEGAHLLFPGDDARDLSELPRGQAHHIVVLDGTWPNARSLYRAHPWLRDLPKVAFTPSAPSRYRIRKEPKAEYVSTLESICAVLEVLEPTNLARKALLSAFDAMIDRQVDMHQRHRRPRTRARPKVPKPPPIPRELIEAERVVYLDDDQLFDFEGRHEHFGWWASDGTEEHLWFAEPERLELGDEQRKAMGLRAKPETTPASEVRTALRAFVGGSLIVAWRHSTLRRLQEWMPELRNPLVPLKGVYANRFPKGPRRLDQIVLGMNEAPEVESATNRLVSRGRMTAEVGALLAREGKEAQVRHAKEAFPAAPPLHAHSGPGPA